MLKLRYQVNSLKFNNRYKPRTALVLPAVTVFIIFVVFLALAARFVTRFMCITFIIIGTILTIALFVATVFEYRRGCRCEGEYKPGLCYTVLVILATIPLFTGLYARSWYPQLRSDKLDLSTDSVTQVRFPSVAVLQRKDWTSQGNLRSGGSKCFLGWYDDHAPTCSTLDPKSLGNNTICKCEELWYNDDQVIENFIWKNTSYRYKVFDSPSWFVGQNPAYMLLLQSFFDFNASKALDDSSQTIPTLSIAVYDPNLGMQNAFDLGYTRMNVVSANGILTVNIGLQLRDIGNGLSAYDYALSQVAAPARDIVCDTSSAEKYKWPCYLSLFIQIPSFDRSIITTAKAMTWVNVASSAGGWFSFLQFLGWILSAQAWRA